MQNKTDVENKSVRTSVESAASEERFRLTIETMNEGLGELDVQGRWTYVNRRMGEFLGLESEELIGRSPAEFLDEENRGIFEAQMTRRVEGEVIPYELSWCKSTGEKMHSLISPQARFDEDNVLIGSFAIITDITARKKAEDELKAANAELESRVEARTAELADLNRSLRAEIEKQREAEVALSASERQLRRVLENIPSFVLTLDREGEIMFANRMIPPLDIPTQVLGVSVLKAIAPADQDNVREDIRKAFETGETFIHDIRALGPNETSGRYECRVVPIESEGKIHEVLYVATDVTDRKQMELELRVSEQRLAEAQRQAHLGHWSWDIRSDALTWSDEIYRILGRVPGEVELTREGFQEVIHPDDRDYVEQYIRRVAAGGETHPIDYRIILPRGEVRFVTGHSELLCGDDGQPNELRGTFQDITSRKAAEEALRESESRLAEAQRIARVGSFVWDMIDDSYEWSDEMFRIFGYRPGEVEPSYKIAMDAMHPEERIGLEPRVRELSSPHNIGSTDFRLILVSGEIKTVHADIEMTFGENDRALKMRGTLQDITERKKVEDELANYREHLEDLVAERTAALRKVQEELVRTERLAALGEITGTVSHELRNPLGTIRNSLFSMGEILKRADDDANLILGRANRSIDRCDRIIEELLEYTRTTRFAFMSTEIDPWLATLVSDYDFPPHIEIETSVQARGRILIDMDRLYRCMVNLFSNAVQAVDELGETEKRKAISIRSFSEGASAFIEVADTGVGIESDDIDRIFEPLFSTKGFGVGLGLSIVKQIVEGHGGSVKLRSKRGQGATFILRLPLENGDAKRPGLES